MHMHHSGRTAAHVRWQGTLAGLNRQHAAVFLVHSLAGHGRSLPSDRRMSLSRALKHALHSTVS